MYGRSYWSRSQRGGKRRTVGRSSRLSFYRLGQPIPKPVADISSNFLHLSAGIYSCLDQVALYMSSFHSARLKEAPGQARGFQGFFVSAAFRGIADSLNGVFDALASIGTARTVVMF